LKFFLWCMSITFLAVLLISLGVCMSVFKTKTLGERIADIFFKE
jgi:hypothetical protein